MEKKNIDWSNLGFEYVQTDKRYVSNYRNGAWDEGGLTEDANVVINECAGVLQYSQSCFEGLKAYTTQDGHIVTFRPDLNAARMEDSAKRLEMPVFPQDRFIEAVEQVVAANAAYVPPYGSGATMYLRPYMFGSNPVIGVKPADEYQFRIFATPVGPYFKGGVRPLTICVSDFDRAAPHGTGHIKAGLNYAMSLHAIMTAHANGFDENMYLDPATRTKVEETGGANFLFVTKDNTRALSATNVTINQDLIDNADLLATKYNKSDGEANVDLIVDLINTKDAKIFDGGTGSFFLESIVSDMSIDANKATNFTKNYTNLQTTIQNQRLSIMGVDTDEEAMDLVKFQQAYNLSSKMMTVMNQLYDRLINNTGV